ncbi:tRNA (guanosine(46)-N7)-methyltransferase TrmB [Trichothermofontia sp.]
MAAVRVRQHVNPLSQRYQQPLALPDWSTVFADPTRPLWLDIGCGRGYFVQQMAQLEHDAPVETQRKRNFLGLEIREPLVEQANTRRDALHLTNLHYLFYNANVGLRALLDSLPVGVLRTVSVQFPDPWFKKRHQKRRVVQPQLVADLADILVPGGEVFLQSDIEAVAQEMCDRFLEHPAFERQGPLWLPDNPLPVMTERERSTLARGEPVYRVQLRRRCDS